MRDNTDPTTVYGGGIIWATRGIAGITGGLIVAVPGAFWENDALLALGLLSMGIGLLTVVLTQYIWSHD